MCACVCVCVCVEREEEKGRQKDIQTDKRRDRLLYLKPCHNTQASNIPSNFLIPSALCQTLRGTEHKPNKQVHKTLGCYKVPLLRFLPHSPVQRGSCFDPIYREWFPLSFSLSLSLSKRICFINRTPR